MAAGLEVADIFRRHGDAYRRAHAGHLGRVEHRVMSAIALCRTAELGGHSEVCTACGLVRCAYNSCRNRHCPKCQGQARVEWLAARQAEFLPVLYFHVVFTLPAAVAEIAFQNKATVYTILFKTAAETLHRIAADRRHLGAGIGLVAVLHTWGQTLHHHPHVHCIVPGGGPSLDGTRWIACRPGFFLPVRVLWHTTAKLPVPDNITLLPLPPKSPELNPVENIWQFMRGPLGNAGGGTTGSPTASSHPTETSSTTAASPGTASPTSPGRSPPSGCAIGLMGADQRALVLHPSTTLYIRLFIL